MSLVHEILYQSDNISKIPFQKYLEELSSAVFQAFADPGRHIDINICAENIFLDVEQAIPCGFVVTELLTNALKYAFVSKLSGKIEIKTCVLKERVEMIISDNGIGFSSGFDPKSRKTLGIRLVTDLVQEQLEGKWTFNNDQGACWHISWPLG